MKTNKLILSLTVGVILNSFGQPKKDIILPKGEEEITINYTTPIFSIYVDKKNNVFVEDNLVEVMQIGKLLRYFIYKIRVKDYVPYTRIFIYADKRANYLTIDKVKTEVASTNIFNLVYKTGGIEDRYILKGLSFRNHESFFKYYIEKRKTKKEEEKTKRHVDSLKKIKNRTRENMFFPPPPPPPLHWTAELKERLYTDQQEIIDEILLERDYSCIRITNAGIEMNKELVKFNELSEIEKLFLNNDVLLVNFDKNLIYENYFKMITIIRGLERKHKDNHIPLFVEMSSEINEIHKKSGIKICN